MDGSAPTLADELQRRLQEVAAVSGADLCVLFGSRAGICASDRSDVDLALWFAVMPSPERRLRLIGEFQTAAGEIRVDVVFLHRDTDPVLRFEIFHSGQLLFEKTAGEMIEARVRAFMLFDDALPLRRPRRERLLDVT